jgi:ferric-dicitrate binding protein FerR (iron transport regulator)
MVTFDEWWKARGYINGEAYGYAEDVWDHLQQEITALKAELAEKSAMNSTQRRRVTTMPTEVPGG